ncbi:hypothetical protein FB451DRAFT_1408508 [Mycena latifolia]|nr:hypothetical protein FB451DRAFT_1408508 [Mycena latifolia]
MTSTPLGKSAPGGPKYINDFSKALAGEVQILLAEIGKLRDEKRAPQSPFLASRPRLRRRPRGPR